MDGEGDARERARGRPYDGLEPGIGSPRTIHELLGKPGPRDYRLFSGILAPEPHDDDCCCLGCHPDWLEVPEEAWTRRQASEPARRLAAQAREREQAMQEWSV